MFNAAAAPSFKEKDRQLLAWYAREVANCPGLTVRMNTEVKDIASLHADEVVVATGSVPVQLPVPKKQVRLPVPEKQVRQELLKMVQRYPAESRHRW